jgi:hypothetical protein
MPAGKLAEVFMRFTIRDVLWLMVVVAVAMGWWFDQDRIRRQSESLKAESQRLQALPLRHAEAKLKVTEAELASMVEMNQRSPGVIPQSELRRVELQREVANVEVETSRAKEFGPAGLAGPEGRHSE